MDGWDVALLVVAGYIAITVLVRMMLARRNRLVDQLAQQVEQQQKRQKTQQRRTGRRAG